jgi:hypothetical protein
MPATLGVGETIFWARSLLKKGKCRKRQGMVECPFTVKQRKQKMNTKGIVEYDQHDWSCTLNPSSASIVRYSAVVVSLEDLQF